MADVGRAAARPEGRPGVDLTSVHLLMNDALLLVNLFYTGNVDTVVQPLNGASHSTDETN